MTDDALLSMLDVEPAALFTFSKNLMDKATAANSKISENMRSLGSAKFGFAPVASCGPLARGYVGTLEQTGKFMEDAQKGSGAFMAGAQTIAANYVISDDAGKDEMSDVQSAFDVANVPAGQQTYSQQYAADQKKTEDTVGAIDPVELPDATDSTPNDDTQPEDTPAEDAAQDAQTFRDDDQEDNNGNGFEDAYPSEDAPESVQIEANQATPDDPTILVVGEDGSLKRVTNPIYEPPATSPYANDPTI